MSEFGKAATVLQSRLDLHSKQTLGRLIIRLCGLILFIVLPYFAGLRSFSVMLQLLSTFMSIGSIFCAMMALLCREHVGRGSLNHWDEALAYMALTRLVHFAETFHG